MIKRKIGFVLLIISFISILMTVQGTVTGYVIVGQASPHEFFYIVPLVFFLMSLLLLTSRTYLDAIIVPTEASTSRIKNKARVASEAYRTHHAKVIVASGGVMPYMDPQYKHEAHVVYKELRKAGIRPAEIRVDGTSRDNLENILHSLKKLEGTGATDIGIVSYPAHLDRFENIIKKAREEGLISEETHFHRIETDQTLTETLWEIPAKILTNYQLRRGVRGAKTRVGSAKKALYWLVRKLSD